MRFSRRSCFAMVAAVAIGLSAVSVSAQSQYPSQPIRLLVPFAAGGSTDIIARAVADGLGRQVGQAVVVDNRGGAGGVVGASETARAKPDGYHIGVATVSSHASNPAINTRLRYDPIGDFTPIINMAETPNVLVVHPSFPAANYEEFLAEVKSRPGEYSYASSGVGGIGHLQTELLMGLEGLNMQHIGYRGAGPALNDTVAGQVPVMFDNLPSALPFITSGRLRAIAVAAPERLAVLPDIPTFKELGQEPANRMAYYGLVGPKGMSEEHVEALNAAVQQVLQDPQVRQRIEETGSLLVANTPQEFGRQMADEYEVYKEVVQKQQLTLN